MPENQPLEVFLTHIKRAMHHYTLLFNYAPKEKRVVQTPELRIFPCPQFTIIGYVNFNTLVMTLLILRYTFLFYRNGTNVQGIGYNPEFEFKWSPKHADCLVRGRALFFGQDSDVKRGFKTAFLNLEFNVQDCSKNNLQTTMDSGILHVHLFKS
jgi:hypothetical protein